MNYGLDSTYVGVLRPREPSYRSYAAERGTAGLEERDEMLKQRRNKRSLIVNTLWFFIAHHRVLTF